MLRGRHGRGSEGGRERERKCLRGKLGRHCRPAATAIWIVWYRIDIRIWVGKDIGTGTKGVGAMKENFATKDVKNITAMIKIKAEIKVEIEVATRENVGGTRPRQLSVLAPRNRRSLFPPLTHSQRETWRVMAIPVPHLPVEAAALVDPTEVTDRPPAATTWPHTTTITATIKAMALRPV